MKPRIKVLHILEAVAGGTRKVVDLQVRNLDQELFDVSICIPTPSAIAKTRKGELNDPQFGESLKKDGFKVFEIAMLSEQLFSYTNLIAVIKLVKLFKEHHFDIIHCSSSIAGFLGRISAKISGVPVIIYSPHGFSFVQVLSKTKYYLYRIFEKIAGSVTDAFILSSNQEKEETLELNLTKCEKILILENPIETGKYSIPARTPFSGNQNKHVIGMVARLVPQKKPTDFVRMAHHLNNINSNVEFIIVGDGRLHSDVRKLMLDLNVTNITMLGNRTDYLKVMSTFSVLVMTSLWEGLPYAPIEAMLLGIPTVLTDVSGVRDLLGKYAQEWIVPLNSPEKMAKIVNRILLNYSIEKQKVLLIRQTIIERFDSKVIAKRLGNYYIELFNNAMAKNQNLSLKT
jgi:glycosyltransferase involved in cell wall biosynthesis